MPVVAPSWTDSSRPMLGSEMFPVQTSSAVDTIDSSSLGQVLSFNILLAFKYLCRSLQITNNGIFVIIVS